jgi:hypothetical protein
LPQAGHPDRTAEQRSDEERDDADVTELDDRDRLAAVVSAATNSISFPIPLRAPANDPDRSTVSDRLESLPARQNTDGSLTRFGGRFVWLSKCLILLEATPGIEPGYTVLQTVA